MAPRTRARVVDGQLVQETLEPAKPASSSTDDPASKLDVRENGTVRRSAGGGRSFADYFSQENRNKPVARGELLGFLEWYSHNLKYSVWWRRAWAWLARQPIPPNMVSGMADAFMNRQVKPTAEALAELRREKFARGEE